MRWRWWGGEVEGKEVWRGEVWVVVTMETGKWCVGGAGKDGAWGDRGFKVPFILGVGDETTSWRILG